MCKTRKKANKMKRKQNKKLEVMSATGQKSERKGRQKNIQVLKVDGAGKM